MAPDESKGGATPATVVEGTAADDGVISLDPAHRVGGAQPCRHDLAPNGQARPPSGRGPLVAVLSSVHGVLTECVSGGAESARAMDQPDAATQRGVELGDGKRTVAPCGSRMTRRAPTTNAAVGLVEARVSPRSCHRP
jgi:hypothetical protein